MSNDPLESFHVPKKQTPDLDSLPSMRAASAKPIDTRSEPKLSARTTDSVTDAPEKSVKAVRPKVNNSKRRSAEPDATAMTETSKPAEPINKAHTENQPAEKTKKDLKATMRAAKQTARQAERRHRHRKSRGSRFAMYLVITVAAGFVLAIAGNWMIQSMEQLRDAHVSSSTSADIGTQQTSGTITNEPN